MKNAIQQQLRQEYERRKSEFASYVDFINSTANESDEIRIFREQLAQSRISWTPQKPKPKNYTKTPPKLPQKHPKHTNLWTFLRTTAKTPEKAPQNTQKPPENHQ